MVGARGFAEFDGVARHLEMVGDGDARLDAGYPPRDVAEVRRALAAAASLVVDVDAERAQVVGHQLQQNAVRHRVLVARHVLLPLEPAAGGARSALCAGDHPLYHFGQVLRVIGPRAVANRGIVGNDVGRCPAAQDDAVDAHVRPNLLPEHADGVVEQHHRVQRVETLFGCASGVSSSPVEVELEAARGQRAIHGDRRLGRGVEHDGRVHLGKNTGIDHVHLAARVGSRAFLGRCAEYPDRPVQLGDDFRQRQAGADGRGTDQVVSAAVAQPGQRVILGQDRNSRPRTALAAELGLEGGPHASRAGLDRDAGRLQQARQTPGRLDLLVADLRMSVNPIGSLDQLGGLAVDRLTDAVFQLLDVISHQRYLYLSRVPARASRGQPRCEFMNVSSETPV